MHYARAEYTGQCHQWRQERGTKGPNKGQLWCLHAGERNKSKLLHEDVQLELSHLVSHTLCRESKVLNHCIVTTAECYLDQSDSWIFNCCHGNMLELGWYLPQSTCPPINGYLTPIVLTSMHVGERLHAFTTGSRVEVEGCIGADSGYPAVWGESHQGPTYLWHLG